MPTYIINLYRSLLASLQRRALPRTLLTLERNPFHPEFVPHTIFIDPLILSQSSRSLELPPFGDFVAGWIVLRLNRGQRSDWSIVSQHFQFEIDGCLEPLDS
jgi:hypothetical protein